MKILFEDCIYDSNYIYFVARDWNLIFKMNVTTGEKNIIGSFPEEKMDTYRLGAKIVKCNDELIFSPMNAKKIWKFNLSNQTWEGYERRKLHNWTEKEDMFQCVEYNGKLFFIGCYYPAIIVFDLLTNEMDYITKPFDDVKNVVAEKQECFFRTDYVKVDNYIYLASCFNNSVLKLNLDDYKYEYLSVGNSKYSYAGICYDGKKFYLPPRKKGPIVVWNGADKVEEIHIDIDNQDDNVVFAGAISLENKIVFPACFSENTVEIIKEGNSCKSINTKEQIIFYKQIDNNVVACLKNDASLSVIVDNREYNHIVEIDDVKLGEYLKENMRVCDLFEQDMLMYETSNKTLELLIGMIK